MQPFLPHGNEIRFHSKVADLISHNPGSLSAEVRLWAQSDGGWGMKNKKSERIRLLLEKVESSFGFSFNAVRVRENRRRNTSR